MGITEKKQLQQSCPKTVFYNGSIQQGNGDVCTTDLQLQNAMLATRQFWFEEPVQDDLQWNEYLTSYEMSTVHWPFIDCPEDTDYIKTLFFTKDLVPGPDGIPYSAWRLLLCRACTGLLNCENSLGRVYN